MDVDTKKQLQVQVQRYFLEFLETFTQTRDQDTNEVDHYYIDQAERMVKEDERTLYVKMTHLFDVDSESLSFDPKDLKDVIMEKYLVVKDALDAAVPQLLKKLDKPELVEKVQDVLRANELSYSVAFYDLPNYNGIRDLRTDKMGQLVTICGTVTRMTEVKPELLVGTFKCNECAREVSGVVQQFKVTMPAICPGRNCGNRTNWELQEEARTTRWGDWQRVRLQENENEVPPGSMPRSLDIIVRDEQCDQCKPGDKVLMTGTLIVVPDVPSLMSPAELKQSVRRSLNRSDAAYGSSDGVRGLKGLGQRDLTYKMAFLGVFCDQDNHWNGATKGSVSENVRSEEKLFLSQQDKDRFQTIAEHVGASGKRDCFDVLARSIAPSVLGHLEVKKGILLMLVGGAPKKTPEGIKLRGDINVCMIGDPATAKSALLKWVAAFLPRAVFASGKGTTAAGLTASVTREAEFDEKVIEPGALMLADNGVCCIDEFEQMDEKDVVAIHEAMEQQTITLSKAGIQATLNARASVLAAVLPKNTYYQPTLPIHKNINLTAPIISRFDLMHVIQDIHDEAHDKVVAEHIVALHRGKETQPQLSMLDLQRYIRMARSYNPRITPEARAKLCGCYKKLREDRTFVRGAAGVTVRQLESLIRLSEAVARVNLDEFVREEYVVEAFELQSMTLKRVESEDIDLSPDVAEVEPPRPPAGESGAAAEDAAAPAPAADAPVQRKVKVTYPEYQRIGMMLATHLAQKAEAGEEVTEFDLTTWYMEQIEDSIQTEAQLTTEQFKVQLMINRMVDKDRVILVYRQSADPDRPEQRVLGKHPNFKIGEVISGRHAEDK